MKRKGFTLVELLPAIVIMGVVMLIISNLLTYGININSRQAVETEAQREARRSITNLSDDIRKGRYFINQFDDNTLSKSFGELYLNYNSNNINIIRPIGFTPVLYIEQINGDRVLYAYRDNNDKYGEAAKELHRYKIKAASDYTYGYVNSSVGQIDSFIMKYYSDNYRITVDNRNVIGPRPLNVMTDIETPFFYYQGNEVFECVKAATDPADSYSTIKMVKQPIDLDNNLEDEIIANKIRTISLNKGVNSYKINIKVMQKDLKTGYKYDKILISNIALGNYGGDGDNE